MTQDDHEQTRNHPDEVWQTWSPTPGRLGKAIAWVVLVGFVAAMALTAWLMARG